MIDHFDDLITKVNAAAEVAYLTTELREHRDENGPTERLETNEQTTADDLHDWLISCAQKHGVPGLKARMRVRIYGPKGQYVNSSTCHILVPHDTAPVDGGRVDKDAEMLFILDQQRAALTFIAGGYQRLITAQRDITGDIRAHALEANQSLFSERRASETALNALIDRRIQEAEAAEARAQDAQERTEDRDLIESTVGEVVDAAKTIGMAYAGIPPEATEVLPELLNDPDIRAVLTHPKLRESIKDKAKMSGLAELLRSAVETT
jgi:hypothetical protein